MVKMGSSEPQTNPYDFKIKLTHNFGPLIITLSLRRLFSAKIAMPYFVYLAV